MPSAMSIREARVEVLTRNACQRRRVRTLGCLGVTALKQNTAPADRKRGWIGAIPTRIIAEYRHDAS